MSCFQMEKLYTCSTNWNHSWSEQPKISLPITFMDGSKAFNLVYHNGLLCIIHNIGVGGALWDLHNHMYEGITSMVKWESLLSKTFEEFQGIRQGGGSSADIFKDNSTPLLNRTSEHHDSFSIGHVKCGAIMVADDLVLASKCDHGMQTYSTRLRLMPKENDTYSVKLRQNAKSSMQNTIRSYQPNLILMWNNWITRRRNPSGN